MANGRKPEGNGSARGQEDVIGEIREAEDSAVRGIAKARERRDARIAKAQEKARAIREKAASESEALTERMVSESGKAVAAEAESLFAAARKEEESVRRKKVDARLIDSAFGELLEELNA